MCAKPARLYHIKHSKCNDLIAQVAQALIFHSSHHEYEPLFFLQPLLLDPLCGFMLIGDNNHQGQLKAADLL